MNYRITKLREYLFNIIDQMIKDNKYQINADFLGEQGDFSLDRVPTNTNVQKWIIGSSLKKDVYGFRSRKLYTQDTLNNLANIGFFEEFESIIRTNNEKGILPDIDGIESIECLNSGTLITTDGKNATFNIQIQITYIEDTIDSEVSL